MNQEVGPYQIESSGVLIWDLPASGTVRNKCLWFKLPRQWYPVIVPFHHIHLANLWLWKNPAIHFHCYLHSSWWKLLKKNLKTELTLNSPLSISPIKGQSVHFCPGHHLFSPSKQLLLWSPQRHLKLNGSKWNSFFCSDLFTFIQIFSSQ